MTDFINEILQTMRTNKLRTALTGFAVSWGIFMLIVLLSMARGVTNAFEYNMGGTGSKVMKVWGGTTSMPYHGYREGRRIKLQERDFGAIYKGDDGNYVADVTSVSNGTWGTMAAGKNYISSGYSGVYPSYIDEQKFTMKEGRFITDKDMDEKAKVMVLSQRSAEALFPPDGKAVGKRVNIGGLSFLVVGVYDHRWMRDNFIPYITSQAIGGKTDELDQITVLLSDNVADEVSVTGAEEQVRNSLAANHDYSPDDKRAVWIFNRFKDQLQAASVLGILNLSVWILGMLTLLSGIIGISNIMFVSVRERTHEIGIRRAIGAKPRSILLLVIAESVAITTLFGYIGVILGTAVTQLLSAVIGEVDFLRNPTVSLAIAFQVTVVLIVCGALAGLFPALRALKVKPVEALRDE